MRSLIWISGSENWCSINVNALIRLLPKHTGHIIYCGTDDQVQTGRQINIYTTSRRGEIERYLGTECTTLIINCYQGFNPELFCALCGTVQSPGIIVLLTPSSSQWPTYPDPDYINLCSFPFSVKDVKGRFIRYFTNRLRAWLNSGAFMLIEENGNTNDSFDRIRLEVSRLFCCRPAIESKLPILNALHRRVIGWIFKALDSETHGVLVLSGRRGRGKSTLLGIGLNRYASLHSQPVNVCVVSQTRSNVQPIFTHVCGAGDSSHSNKIAHNSLLLSFHPPDDFLRQSQQPDLLIVDEAAAVPLPQLYRMIASCPKIILSTTTDGYEGTGMGFRSKLKAHLDNNDKPLCRIKLIQPLRWSDDDAVENFLQNCLLHDQSPIITVADRPERFEARDLIYQKLDRDELSLNSELIAQIYTLFSFSHYRTTPDDLRFMLDAPGVEIWVAYQGHKVYGAMLISTEGRLPDELHNDIWLGMRRLRGQLIPQCIAAQCGFKSACSYNFKRVIRIAVDQSYRHIGIGKNLVDSVINAEPVREVDFFGVSFGYDNNIFKFWNTMDFIPVKLGYRENARSGARSLIMLKPFTERAEQLLTCLCRRHKNEIEFWISRRTDHMQSRYEDLLEFHSSFDKVNECLTQDGQDIYSFAFGNRQFDHCEWVLYKYAKLSMNNSKTRSLLTPAQIQLLTLKIIEGKNWKSCADSLGYTGKKETLVRIKQAYAVIYDAVWGNKS